MAPGKRVYGKAARAQHGFAACIFAESSSSPFALKGDRGSVLLSSPGSQVSPISASNNLCAVKHERDTASELELTVGKFKQLRGDLDDDLPQLPDGKNILKTPSESRTALQQRNANEILESPRSIRAKRRREQRNQERIDVVHNNANTGNGREVSRNVGKHPGFVDNILPSKISSVIPATRSERLRGPKSRPTTCHADEKSQSGDPVYEDYTRPILRLSNKQTTPSSFQSWSNALIPLFNITKIAEASYGEVYRLSLKHKCAKNGVTVDKTEESVLKLIALKPPPDLPNQPKSKAWKEKIAGMSEIVDVAGEVRLLKKMTPVPGFTNFRDVLVLQGRLPRAFVKAWQDFNDRVKKSFFPDPGRKTSYPEDQLWAMIEMQDAGQDLESTAVEDAYTIWDVFWGVSIAVAKGEEYASFEHRDLHLGNVCVKKVSSTKPNIDPNKTMGFTSLETTIIDYTLSRARMNSNPEVIEDNVGRQQDDIAHFDLSKDSVIFSGDETEDYQYAIYRYMRSAVIQHNPLAPCASLKAPGKGRKPLSKVVQGEICAERAAWKEFHPLTNVVWLHFILYTLLGEVKKSLSSTKSTLLAKEQEHHDMLLDRLVWLRDTLLSLQGLSAGVLVAEEQIKLKSAGELVTWAVYIGWLAEDDVVGIGRCHGEEASGLDLPDVGQLTLGENTSGQPSGQGKTKPHRKCQKNII